MRPVPNAAATVQVETHALGLVCYGLTAFVYAAEPHRADSVIAAECAWFYDRLLHWAENTDQGETVWAPFLLRDDLPNKERLLRRKMEHKSHARG